MISPQAFVISWVLSAAAAVAASGGPEGGATQAEASAEPRLAAETESEALDQLALSGKAAAIDQLTKVAEKRKGLPNEPELVSQLMEMLYSAAGISSRSGYSQNVRSETLDFSAKTAYLKKLDTYTSRLIETYGRHPSVPRAYYLRARARRELGNTLGAIADFKQFAARGKSRPEHPFATLTLCEMLMAAKDHRTALQYLRSLDETEKGLVHNIALDKTAWAHFFLDDIPSAFQALGRELAELDPENPADRLVTERTVPTAALFFDRGMEKRLAEYRADSAYDRFAELFSRVPRLAESALVQLAYHLRSKDRDADLASVLSENKKRKALTLELAAVIGGHQLNQRKYENFRETAHVIHQTLAELPADERSAYFAGSGKLGKELASWMRELQDRYVKNKNTNDARRISLVLVPLYETYLKMPGKERDAPIRFNLAEIQFGQSNFAPATLNYRWVYRVAKKTIPTAELRSIESRFKELEVRQLTARSLQARALPAEKNENARELPKELSEWVEWVDACAADQKFAPPSDAFVFEATRAIYKAGDLERALARLTEFAAKHPTSDQAKGSASLALDTWIASQRWTQARDFAETLIADPAWKKNALYADLYRIAGDARIRLIEDAAAGDTKEVLAMIREFQARYPAHARLARALEVGATVAMKAGDKPVAQSFFAALRSSGKLSGPMVGLADLNRAAIADENFDLRGSALAYLDSVSGGPGRAPAQVQDVGEKTVLYAWLSGDAGLIQRATNAAYCQQGALRSACAIARLAGSLTSPGLPAPAGALDAPVLARTSGTDLILRAALRLKSPTRKFSAPEARGLLQALAQRWQDPEPLMELAAVRAMLPGLHEALQSVRAQVASPKIKRLEPAPVQARMTRIDETERLLQDVAKIHWSPIRKLAFETAAQLREDLDAELASLTMPKGLTGDDAKAYGEAVAGARAETQAQAKVWREQAAAADEPRSRFSTFEAAVWNRFVKREGTPRKAAFFEQAKTAHRGNQPALLVFLANSGLAEKVISEEDSQSLRALALTQLQAYEEARNTLSDDLVRQYHLEKPEAKP